MMARRFKHRAKKMRILADGGFYCQTIADGACDLSDPLLAQAITMMRPVVVLDTAIRFQSGEENSSTDQAQGLGAKLFKLINLGAQAVICMHHRKKDALKEELSLENALRGSGDFGAMADCVWAMEHQRVKAKGRGNGWDEEYTKDSKDKTRLRLECVKPRDMEPADPFVIQGRPYIDERGDFVVVSADKLEEEEREHANTQTLRGKIATVLEKTPSISLRNLAAEVHTRHQNVSKLVRRDKEGDPWQMVPETVLQ
jgi:hypothetical protein